MKIDTRKKVIWLILGCLLLGGGIVFTGFSLIFFSYSPLPHIQNGVEIGEDSEANEREFSINSSILIDEFVYLPIVNEKDARKEISQSSYWGSNQIVNFIVIDKKKSTSALLFAKDVSVESTVINRFENQIKNYYLVVPEDTNNDGRLNSDDDLQLWESALNGQELVKVIDNVKEINTLDEKTILIQRNVAMEKTILYNSETKEKYKVFLEDNQ